MNRRVSLAAVLTGAAAAFLAAGPGVPARAAEPPATQTAVGPDEPSSPASQPAEVLPSQQPEAIERLARYYLDLYEKHLSSPDWMARSMGVISLARIDDARATERLAKVMIEDQTPIVRVYAWESLHARLVRLTSDQRMQWEKVAFELAEKGILRGDLRLAVVGLIDAGGPTVRNKRLLMGLFMNTNSMDPGDIRTLWAIGDTLKRWESPDLIGGLIELMGALDHAYRAELVLRRISTDPTDPPPSEGLRKRGSEAMWRQTQQAWAVWFGKQTFTEIDPGQGGPYRGGASTLMPPGEPILDTRDEKWRKDLELSKFRIDQLDVGFAIDATGSMGRIVRWIQNDVLKIMRAFELISREPRMGVVFYRDYGDEYVFQGFPLTGSGQKLAGQIRGATAKGGGDIPEAVYEALYALVKKNQWSREPEARKVVVLFGDAPPHEKTNDNIQKLVRAGVQEGFRFYTFKVRTHYEARMKRLNKTGYDPQLTTLDRIAETGRGESFWISFLDENESSRNIGVAKPNDENSPERAVFREILRAVLEKGYADRIDPFINVLLEYVEEPLPEQRRPFSPARPGRGGPPPDPQRR